jgi:hypothetical protein
MQRFQPLEEHPGIERTHGRTGGAQESVNIDTDPLLIADHRPTDATALTVQILGRGMDD